jgi:hypothetical protein
VKNLGHDGPWATERPDSVSVPPVKPSNRSPEELAMRELVVARLRLDYPSARIIHELPLRYSSNRIDLAAVTETEIVSVEIKSSRDVSDRLEGQLRAFQPISARMIIALAPVWNVKLPLLEKPFRDRGGRSVTSFISQYTEAQSIVDRVGGAREIWTVDADAGSIDITDSGYRNSRPWLAKMLDMLHVAELVEVASRHHCWSGKRPVHEQLVAACHDLMTGREIVTAVCAALRRREAFARGTDPPNNG